MSKQAEMATLTRKTIAAASVARLDAIGAYDCEYDNLALAITRELGLPIPSRADMRDIEGRIADLVILRLEAASN